MGQRRYKRIDGKIKGFIKFFFFIVLMIFIIWIGYKQPIKRHGIADYRHENKTGEFSDNTINRSIDTKYRDSVVEIYDNSTYISNQFTNCVLIFHTDREFIFLRNIIDGDTSIVIDGKNYFTDADIKAELEKLRHYSKIEFDDNSFVKSNTR